ncbi:NAD(P)H-hydrate dehydratase [Gracilibacillus halophilus]|nr:NAD(P)H-hydrate dehydratase [Gracilibacillus halophilus]
MAEKISERVSLDQHITIVIGGGNNGGDGFVIARCLKEKGYQHHACQLVPDQKIKGDALYHKQVYEQFGGMIERVETLDQLKEKCASSDVVVDAVLGIGITGTIREPLRRMIEVINEAEAVVFSVDIPSGLPANENEVVDMSVNADYTFVVEAPKQSAFVEGLAPYYGEWEVVSIGIPLAAFSDQKQMRWQHMDVQRTFPKRTSFSHKGSHGKGAVVGGQLSMPGSVALTARAALRSGAGLLTVATVKDNIPVVANQCVEAMYHVWRDDQGILIDDSVSSLNHYDAIAIGMGMGRADESQKLTLRIVNEINRPVIVDADGLYHIKSDLEVVRARLAPLVITPHLGEMAMLTETTIAEIKQAPFSITKQFAQKYQVYVVLKGKFTIITTPRGEQVVTDTGNPGLAKGGSGDVLSGVILAFMMQHNERLPAIANACYLHGLTADMSITSGRHTETDLLASDVIDELSVAFRTIV